MRGLAISPGIGIGKAFVIEKKEINVSHVKIENAQDEINRLRDALRVSKTQIETLYKSALESIGEKEAEIFKSHEMMLEDFEFISDIEKKINCENVNAEYALCETAKKYIDLFTNIEDDYFKERAEDIKDVIDRILKNILGLNNLDFSNIDKNTIIIAKELTASDTANLNKDIVSAMIVENGGKTSHAAIIARIMGIPAVFGLNNLIDSIKNGDDIICDGNTGEVIISPDEDQLNHYKKYKENEERLYEELKKHRGFEAITKDGTKISVCANIGTSKDIFNVIDNDADGIGLLRSEFIFFNTEKEPTEQFQFEEYKKIALKMKDKPIIIRTLDIGGDKNISYLNIEKEMNPFLGYRAIRFCLGNKKLFKTQLRAILRASAFGNIKIMFPMISTIQEIRQCKEILQEVKDSLRIEKIAFDDDLEIGIMMEVPSAVMISDLLAKEVDFFSIGTNDLVQYTMAADRLNSKMSYLYSEYHPSILRMINLIIKNAHNEGIWVGMCGEAAGDFRLIPVFLGMGLDEISMSPGCILRSKYIIRNLKKQDMLKIATKVLTLETSYEVEKFLNAINMFSNIRCKE